MAWSRPDFVLFNGTNVLPVPRRPRHRLPGHRDDQDRADLDGRDRDAAGAAAAADVPRGQLPRPGGHAVLRGPLRPTTARRWTGAWTRLATYPAGSHAGSARDRDAGTRSAKMIPAEAAVFGETPWQTLHVMMIFDSSYGGGSALEHTNSHVGIYNPRLHRQPDPRLDHRARDLPRLEREAAPAGRHGALPLRPERAHRLALGERGDHRLLRRPRPPARRHRRRRSSSSPSTGDKIAKVAAAPPTSLEDASLSTWIHPTDGSEYLYYPKGSLAGFMLDIMIRDASDNQQSLDDVMRELYRTTYKTGRGFTGADWWAAVSQGGGRQELHRLRGQLRGRPRAVPLGAGPAARGPRGRERHDSRGAARHLGGAGLDRRGGRPPGAARRRRRGGRRQGRRHPRCRSATSRSPIPTSAPSSGRDSARRRANRCPSRCGAMARP